MRLLVVGQIRCAMRATYNIAKVYVRKSSRFWGNLKLPCTRMHVISRDGVVVTPPVLTYFDVLSGGVNNTHRNQSVSVTWDDLVLSALVSRRRPQYSVLPIQRK